MNKKTFIETLRRGLKNKGIKDIDDILEDYETYFYNQLQSGKSEDEIANRLGDINKIIDDYKTSFEGKRNQWFDYVSIGFIAVPMLIILYGLLIIFIGTIITTWAIAIYYLFQINTFSFLPTIPLGVHLLYVLTFLSFSLLFFSLSVHFFVHLKSMTTQYLVRQSIRIGYYQVKSIYRNILKYSAIISTISILLTYIVSAILAQDLQYWHVWNWFN
jgi:uncharacterized membrane protein